MHYCKHFCEVLNEKNQLGLRISGLNIAIKNVLFQFLVHDFLLPHSDLAKFSPCIKYLNHLNSFSTKNKK